jgi:hypothetical protein
MRRPAAGGPAAGCAPRASLVSSPLTDVTPTGRWVPTWVMCVSQLTRVWQCSVLVVTLRAHAHKWCRVTWLSAGCQAGPGSSGRCLPHSAQQRRLSSAAAAEPLHSRCSSWHRDSVRGVLHAFAAAFASTAWHLATAGTAQLRCQAALACAAAAADGQRSSTRQGCGNGRHRAPMADADVAPWQPTRSGLCILSILRARSAAARR